MSASPSGAPAAWTNLRAGVARVDITPPLPIDGVGFVRRAAPMVDVLSPLTATALVVDDVESGDRIAIVAFDLLGIGVEQGRSIRERIGSTIGCPADHVLLNYSHTHAGPHPFDDAPKLGGRLRTVTDSERTYVESLPDRLVGVAELAMQDMHPVRVGAASGTAPGISVNRRERTDDGRTILGWNRDGVLDTEVSVVRIDRDDGVPLATIVGFPCHPVVVGGEDDRIGADYPGVVRDVVEQATGSTCLFLTGAAGDVLPLEGFFDHDGPEVEFGRRVAMEALAAWSRIRPAEQEIHRIEYGSVTPITLFRCVDTDPQPRLPVGGRVALVEFPLKPLPDRDEVAALHRSYVNAFEEARDDGADRARLNPLEYHVVWAESAIEQLDDGSADTSVFGTLQCLRLGPVAFVAIPGEPFNEIGLELRRRSTAPYTFVCGYSNEYIAYFPTRSEYPYGGYEPGYSHHNSRRLEQVDETCEERIVSTLTGLVDEMFSGTD